MEQEPTFSLAHIVAGAPIHACKAYAIYPYVRALGEMRAHALAHGVLLDVVLVDNTDDEGRFAADVRRAIAGVPDAKVVRADPVPSSPLPIHDRITASQNVLRSIALSDPCCVGLLSVECDVIPPPDTARMMLDELDAGGLRAIQARFRDDYDAARFERERFWLMGLSLISREALESISFRYELQRPNGYSDAFFGHDLVARELPFGFTDKVVGKHLGSPTDSSRGWSALSADRRRTHEFSEWLLGGGTP